MGKTAFIFSGQGAQQPGMGADLAQSGAAALQVFAAAERALGRDVQALCLHGSQQELNNTINTQPCTLACDLAAARALIERGVTPQGCAGFSLGELAALAVGGVFSDEDAFGLIGVRARAMQSACDATEGGMVAVIGGDTAAVEALCETICGVWPANYNCPGQLVVAGEKEALARFMAACAERKLRAVALPVSGAFHTPLMAAAAPPLMQAARGITLSTPSMPVYGNTHALPYPTRPQDMPPLLSGQLMRPVRWEQTIRAMVSGGFTRFIECGYGGVLTGLFKRMKLDVQALSYETLLLQNA